MSTEPAVTDRPRARRYADAIAVAAAHEQRITELVGALADAEWHRAHAEETVDALLSRLDLGDQQVINSLDDEPGPDINALVSLVDGKVWVRDETVYMDRSRSKHWHRGEASQRGAISYEWPIEGGPFLSLPEGWELRRQVRVARRRDEAEDQLRDLLRSRPGYSSGVIGQGLPGIVELVRDVLAATDKRWFEIARQRDFARQQLHNIRRLLAEPYDRLEIEDPTNPGSIERVDIARVDAVLAILDRKDQS